MSGQPPLLLVGHGTRSELGVAQFVNFVERVRLRLAGQVPAVRGGFIELASPPVGLPVAELVAAGFPRLAVVPMVLSAAGHGKGDIPATLARERARHAGLVYYYGRPLGPHPLLQEVLAERIAAVDDGGEQVHVLLVGRGSSDPDSNAEVAKVARLLWEGRGYANVEFAFVSLADPGVAAGLERLRCLGARRIVVAPYFLFEGVLPDRIVAQYQEFASEHPELDIRGAAVIGDCDKLALLVAERYREALMGDIRMNCDTCAYRVALPGFGDKLGRPQVPHHHPDELDHEHIHDHDAHDDHEHSYHGRTAETENQQ